MSQRPLSTGPAPVGKTPEQRNLSRKRDPVLAMHVLRAPRSQIRCYTMHRRNCLAGTMGASERLPLPDVLLQGPCAYPAIDSSISPGCYAPQSQTGTCWSRRSTPRHISGGCRAQDSKTPVYGSAHVPSCDQYEREQVGCLSVRLDIVTGFE